MHESNVIAAWALAVHDGLDAAARASGLAARDLAALTLVREHDGCSVDWLHPRVGLTQSGTVRLVDRLVEQGMLERGAPLGRTTPLHATPAAETLLDSWQVARDDVVAGATTGLSAAERADLAAAMATTLEAQQRSRPQADATCRTCTWSSCGEDCPVDRSVHEQE
jgi:DNA-binding MarR family transcriptional regulator